MDMKLRFDILVSENGALYMTSTAREKKYRMLEYIFSTEGKPADALPGLQYMVKEIEAIERGEMAELPEPWVLVDLPNNEYTVKGDTVYFEMGAFSEETEYLQMPTLEFKELLLQWIKFVQVNAAAPYSINVQNHKYILRKPRIDLWFGVSVEDDGSLWFSSRVDERKYEILQDLFNSIGTSGGLAFYYAMLDEILAIENERLVESPQPWKIMDSPDNIFTIKKDTVLFRFVHRFRGEQQLDVPIQVLKRYLRDWITFVEENSGAFS